MSTTEEDNQCIASISEVLQLLAGKWPFLVITELLREPQRFNQLRRNLGKISTKGLTDTLRNLEQHRMLTRSVFLTVPLTVEYSLTDKGKAFTGVFMEINRWKNEWDPVV
ncbi:winged helix-turn-helix transcriptional regulator [Paenibacillus sepulcri]|uniref:Helix-turn-helix transcriptional regulator n=1 Tax=Paenibacillus sepulcri TaxID=359917 RepID=A0ABS7C2Y1_9BACL|nr:helix-turn-helix transcriptional regulator [Paenibacillus sepulcri]